MTAPYVTITCPSCGISKEVPADNIPADAVTVTCRACGRRFALAGQPSPPTEESPLLEFKFEVPPPSAPDAAKHITSSLRPDKQPAGTQFVTAVAWVFIALCGFTAFVSLMQNVMVNTLFPIDEMTKAAMAPGAPKMPAFFRFMMDNIRLLVASILVVSVGMLGAAIGLLKRKNWARLVFVTILSIGIVWNIGGLALQFSIMEDFPKPVGAPPEFSAAFTTMRTVITAFSVLMALAFSAIFGWLIKRFISAEIRREFH